MSGFRNEGLSGRVTEVDTNNNVSTNFTSTLTQIGCVGLGSAVHDGSTGAARLCRQTEINVNHRIRFGTDNILFQDSFEYNAQASGIWNAAASASPAVSFSYTSSSVFLNSGSTTGAGATALLSTWKYFPLYNGVGLLLEMDLNVPQVTDATTTIEFGLFQATGTSTPSDGVFFRLTNNTLYGVLNYGGTETTLNLSGVQTINIFKPYTIRVEQELTTFWIDGTMLGGIATPAAQAGPCISTYQPITFRTIGTSTTASTVKVGETRLFIQDVTTNRPWSQVMSGMGLHGSQGYGGMTQGTTAYYTSDMAIGAGIALANATQATYVGLGGQFDVLPTLAANTDGILCYFRVPIGSSTVAGRSLVITGIKIQGFVTTALTNAAPVIYSYSLAYGATALTLAQTEAAGGASTTKAYRRVPIGVEQYGINAAIGVLGKSSNDFGMNGLNMKFDSPIMANQGEYVTIAVKNVGTVTTAGVITILVAVDSYWE
jgi:hypothetical protein